LAADFQLSFSHRPGYDSSAYFANHGEPLAAGTRARMESILGTRVGDVRIHRGPQAEHAAALVEAPAFAVGNDVVVGAGIDEAVRQANAGA
jgi:hypothetical protein